MSLRQNSRPSGIYALLFPSEQSHLDPNDPANADIMNIVKVFGLFSESIV